MIYDLSITKRKFIASLRTAKHRRDTRLFIIEGTKSVIDNCDFFNYELIAARKEWLDKYAGKFENIELYEASVADLERMTSLSSAPDVIAVCRMRHKEFLPVSVKEKLVLALDCVQDPGNLGTIIRTCDWFGVDTILCSKDCVDIYNPKVIQATMGALSRVDVYYVDLDKTLAMLDVEIFGTFLDGENIYESNLPRTGIIVMGNEGNGIGKDVASKIKNKLTIPSFGTTGHVESLNVSMATAIVLNEFRRRYYGKNKI